MARPLRQFVWDIPTRAFHWLVVALVGFSWWSAESSHMDWHLWSGIGVFGLVIFRLLWGMVGTETSRFRQFVRGPRGVWSYLRGGEGDAVAHIGHNPLGSWSVIGLLAVLAVQVVSGLFAVDVDGIESGPLSDRLSFDHGRLAAAIHHSSFTALKVLVVLHVAAILFYLVAKKRNLTWTMITGTQPLDGEASAVPRAARWRLAAAVAVAAAVAWWIAGGARF